ncbi:MAG: DUF1289 domain-containing protein [Parashewanella sp.]
MEQLEFFEIPNPCINVCQNNNRGYCLGCFRSRQERFDWQKYSQLEKIEVNRLCKQRKKRYRYAVFKAQKKQQAQQQLDLNNHFDFE